MNYKEIIHTHLSKIKKVELSKEQIDLKSSGEEFEEAIKQTNKDAVKAFDEIEKAKSLVSKLESNVLDAFRSGEQASKLYLDVEGLFKQLGVPVTSRFTGMKSDLNSILKELDTALKSVKKANDALR